MRVGLGLALAVLLVSCGHKKNARLIAPPPPPTANRSGTLPVPAAPSAGTQTPIIPPAEIHLGMTESGLASWYGHPYHGRAAADGEIYDMEQMVAAHRTLPFNTWVRVFDLDTSKTVDLRIIDRGPFVDGRVIDISHAAAQSIDMIGPGTANVRIEVIRLPEVIEPALFAVQVGAFRDRQNAERVRSEMESRYGRARLVLRTGNPNVWRVLVGSERDEHQAGDLAARIRKESREKSSAFVVRIDSV